MTRMDGTGTMYRAGIRTALAEAARWRGMALAERDPINRADFISEARLALGDAWYCRRNVAWSVRGGLLGIGKVAA